MAKDHFYITTAIDYTNAAPHIGHAYEKTLADCIARYQRLKGRQVWFLTGVDQHGQKIQRTAEALGIEPAEHVRRVTGLFKELLKALNISNDGWAETTDERHKLCVGKLLANLHEKGQLYKKSRLGFYSERQEQFVTEKERLPDGSWGPEWGEVSEISEENWYFRLSDHIPWLRDFIRAHPDFIHPVFRQADVLNRLDQSDDLCVSRPKNRLTWGIELPFDTDYVNYVWFDALTNYLSFAGYLAEPGSDLPDFDKLWPCDLHVIGKDILAPPHAIYWPVMLHAAGFTDEEMPSLLVHGWWNLGGEKMSKSLGNIVDPMQLVETYGTDAVRFYLLRDIATGYDADFSLERLSGLYRGELGNDLGNLANRTLNMLSRYRENTVPATNYEDDILRALREESDQCLKAYAAAMERHAVNEALEAVWKLVRKGNQTVDLAAPWKLAKDTAAADQLDAVLAALAEILSRAAVLLLPVIPASAAKLLAQLGVQLPDDFRLDQLSENLTPAGHKAGTAEVLFPRIDT